MSVVFQALCTMIIATLSINMGVLMTWPAYTITLFGSENTTLDRPMTETEIGLLGSLSSIGGLISNPAAGYMLDKLGRKYCSIVCATAVAISWTILVAWDRVESVLAGTFMSGFSSVAFLVGGTYCSEICQDSVRGAMASLNMASYGIGMLISYSLGGYLEYHVMLYTGLTMAVAGVAVLFLLEESPTHLMSIDKEKEAAQAMAFYRRLKQNDKVITEELNKIRRTLNPDFDETPEMEKLKPELQTTQKMSVWIFLKKSQPTRRALMVNMVLAATCILQGFMVLQIYMDTLYRETIPNVSPTICSIVMATIMVISGFLAAYLIERAGRRPLMIYASIIVGICCLVLGTQIHLHWGPTWITALFLFIFPVAYNCGAGTVPFVLVAELFLPEIKSFASMVVIEFTWLCSFVMLFIFTPLMNLIGLGPVFYMFALNCFFTSIFCALFLPETKGLSLEAIQLLFAKKQSPEIY